MGFALEIQIIVNMEHMLVGLSLNLTQRLRAWVYKSDCPGLQLNLLLGFKVIPGKLLNLSRLIVFCNNNNNKTKNGNNSTYTAGFHEYLNEILDRKWVGDLRSEGAQ